MKNTSTTQVSHTKGEWDYAFPEHTAEYIYIHAGSELPLAKIPYTGLHAEANAKRIVKCVNMHDELVTMLKNIIGAVRDSEEANKKICVTGKLVNLLLDAKKIVYGKQAEQE